MSKKSSTDLSVPGAPNVALSVVPDHMLADGAMGTETLRKYVLPPRILVVQPTSKPPLDKHDAGTAILLPGEVILSSWSKADSMSKTPIIFTPIYQFNEFTLDNPLEIHQSHGRVRERTFDSNSDLARRAMSRDASIREIPCPEMPDKRCRYVMRMNFLWMITSSESNTGFTPCFVSFKRTEANSARALNTLIMARQAPIFGCSFAAVVGKRSNDRGIWYGFDITNPPLEFSPWVSDPELYQKFKAAHEAAKEAHDAELFEISDADEGVVESVNADF